jgi:hypothetical protein
MRIRKRVAAAIIAASLFAPFRQRVAPLRAGADAVLDWNAIMLTTLAGQNPFAQARFAAVTQLTVFEAVNACTGRYQPYLGTVTARRTSAGAAAHRATR